MAKWTSTKYPDGCISCGTTEKTHIGRGLCSTCYQREARSGEMENNEGRVGVDLGVNETSGGDNGLGSSRMVAEPRLEDVAGDGYETAERPPGFGLSAPPGEPPQVDKPGWRARLFAKRERPAPEPKPTREKAPRVVSRGVGRRVSAADTLGDAWAGIGALAVRSGRHVPLGRYMTFSSGVTGEILDDAIKGTPIDRLILQPVAKGRGRFDALGAVFGPPAIILAMERDPSKAELLLPMLKSSIRNSLPLMAPAIKRLQKKEAEIAAAAAEMGFDGDGDPADQIIAMIFEGWTPPAQPQPEPAETPEDVPEYVETVA